MAATPGRPVLVVAALVVIGLACAGSESASSPWAARDTALPERTSVESHLPAVVVAPLAGPAAASAPLPRFAKLIDAASRAHGVEAALVHAVVHAESSYDPNAVSEAGAIGLMQLMPETARRHGVRDLYDPAENLRGGVKHLKELLALFGGDIELAIAAYNAGENAVIRAGNRIPPYPQTRAFVPRVLARYRELQARSD